MCVGGGGGGCLTTSHTHDTLDIFSAGLDSLDYDHAQRAFKYINISHVIFTGFYIKSAQLSIVSH